MKIAFYDTKPYDKIWFEPLSEQYGYEIKYFEYRLSADTAILAKGFDAVCVFVNDTVNKEVIDILYGLGIRAVLLRCSGYNNVDFKAAYEKIHILRVPSYSPHAVAEHAAALLLTVNRKTHKAYARTRDFNFNISGLMGTDLHNKTAGIIGTGKIGQIIIRILRGFGMQIIAYDPYPAPDADFDYVSLDEIMEKSDVISLHCPLTKETTHIISKNTIDKMKPTVIIINTSRGALINTADLIDGLKERKIGAVGLDVYEEEDEFFFEDKSQDIVDDEELVLLTAFPNVLITSHQAFFTREAMQAIAIVTMENMYAFEHNNYFENEICYQCLKKGSCNREKNGKNCF